MLWFFLSLIFLLIAAWIFIHTPFGQNWIAKQVTNRFSNELKTKISIQHVDFSLFNRMHLKGVMIEDQNHDTLLYAGDLQVRITDWFFLKKKIELKYVGLEDAIFKFQRSDSIWSQQFFFDYFSTPSSGKNQKAGIELNLKKVNLKNVTFFKKDAWFGEDMMIKIGSLQFNGDGVNFSKKIAAAVKKASPCEKVAFVVYGLAVRHAHVHLIPVDGTPGELDFRNQRDAKAEALAEMAKKIKSYL